MGDNPRPFYESRAIYTSGNHELIYSYYPMNGNANKLFHVVPCRAIDHVQDLDEDEVSETRWFTKDEARHMYNHAPPDYDCPFCSLVHGRESIQGQLKQTDIVFRTADVTAFMATRKYPNNQGHVLIAPNKHFENIYDLPLALLSKIHSLSRDIALAIKAEDQCDGILLRQHNEPAGGQNIWHYHLHVIARYQNDDFHNAQKIPFEAGERAEYAEKLRHWFNGSKGPLTDQVGSEK